MNFNLQNYRLQNVSSFDEAKKLLLMGEITVYEYLIGASDLTQTQKLSFDIFYWKIRIMHLKSGL